MTKTHPLYNVIKPGETMEQLAVRLLAERDQLRAHCQRLRDDLQAYHDQYGTDAIARKYRMGEVLAETPEQSLREIQAEAVEKFAQKRFGPIDPTATQYAKQLRNGGNSDG